VKRRVVIAAIAAALGAAAPAHADTFVVNTTADTAGPTGCPSFCTIRNALSAATANGTAVDDVIQIPAGTYLLTQGSLNVTSGRITLDGASANETIIDQSLSARVLDISATATVVRELTLRDGTAATGANVLVGNNPAAATFERVRITGGTASSNGGGIAITGAVRVDLRQSLIDGNGASTTAGFGGGLYVQSLTAGTVLTLEDSTLFNNRARAGGGLSVDGNTLQAITLRGVTVAVNRTSLAAPALYFSQPSPLARIEGSIVAGNIVFTNTGSGTIETPAGCAGSGNLAADGGGNLESLADCGTAGHQNTNPQLPAALDGSQPPVLTIPAGSPAVDIAACGVRTLDQRGAPRPVGLGCDAGAYEVQPPPVEPTPTPTPPPTATPTPTATPSPTPTPVVNRTVVVEPAKGRVLVRRPGTSRFVALDGSAGIPVGSTVDARKGEVFLTSIPRAGAAPERAKFWDGIFKVTQSRGDTTLTLSEALARCASQARSAQKKPKTRRLWGDGKGKFRTKGRYAAATVRGTKWLVTDGCGYTRTRVTQGSVSVRDEVRKRTVIVRKGKSYTARRRPG
jgi:hypothetical protein